MMPLRSCYRFPIRRTRLWHVYAHIGAADTGNWGIVADAWLFPPKTPLDAVFTPEVEERYSLLQGYSSLASSQSGEISIFYRLSSISPDLQDLGSVPLQRLGNVAGTK